MKKVFSAPLLAFMLVVQLVMSGYLAPFTALAADTLQDPPQESSQNTPQGQPLETLQIPDEQTQINDLEKAINTLFKEDQKTMKDDVVASQITTLKAQIAMSNLPLESKELLENKLALVEKQLDEKVEKEKVEAPLVEKPNEKVIVEAAKEQVNKKSEKQQPVKKEQVIKKSQSKKALALAGVINNITVKFDKLVIKKESGNTVIKDGATVANVALQENDEVNLTYKFTIPAGSYVDGDYFVFDLPKNMLKYTDKTGTLNGIGVAQNEKWQYTVDATAKTVKIATPKMASTYVNDLAGEFTISARIGDFESTQKTEQMLIIPTATENIMMTLVPIFHGKYLEQPVGVVSVDPITNKRIVKWKIVVNPDGQPMDNLTISSFLPPELVSIGKITVRDYTVDLSGVIKPAMTRSLKEFTSFPIQLGASSKRYELEYTTEFTDEAFTNKSGKQLFDNVVTVKANGVTENETGTVTVSLPVAIEKEMDSSKANTMYKMHWLVKYNFNKAELNASDAKLTDVIQSPNNMHHITGNVLVTAVDIDRFGNYTRGSTTVLLPTYGTTKNIATIDLSSFYTVANDSAYIIEYVTEADQDDLIAQNATGNVTNSIVDQKSTTIPSVSKGVPFTQALLTKSIEKVNYESKEITWKIHLAAPEEKPIQYAKFSDLFDESSMQYVEESVSVSSNGVAIPSSDYNFDASPSTGFQVDFQQLASNNLTITYKTKMNNPGDTSANYNNKVVMKWKMGGQNELTTTAQASYNPNESTLNNGYKNGVFQYDTNTIDWQVAFNFNKKDVSGSELIDTADNQQLYGDVKVYELKLNSNVSGKDSGNFGEIGAEIQGAVIQQTATGFKVKMPTGLSNANSAYILKYTTKPNDEIYTIDNYQNKTEISKSGTTYTLTNYVTNKNANKFIEKSFRMDGESGEILWTVDINKSHSTLKNITFNDLFSANQTLLVDTVELCNTTFDERGIVGPSNCRPISVNETTNGFNLNLANVEAGTANEAYQIRYRTLYTGNHQGQFTNQATLQYDGHTKVDEAVTTVTKNFYYSDSWGFIGMNVVRENGTLTLLKKTSQQRYEESTNSVTDFTTENPIVPGFSDLAGVQFELWNVNKSRMLYKGVSDAQGKVQFLDAVSAAKGTTVLTGNYVLIERDKVGYQGNGEMGVRVSKDTGISELKMTTLSGNLIQNNMMKNPQYVNSILLYTTDELNNKMPGVEFKLQKADGSQIYRDVDATIYTSDANGKVFIENLPAGKYKLVEVDIHAGYRLIDSGVIVVDTNKSIVPVTKTVKNIICTLSFKNIDEHGAYVKNATYTLTDPQGNTVQGIVYKNSDGTASLSTKGLVDGVYKLKITPSSGYEDAVAQNITISKSATTCPTQFIFVTKTLPQNCIAPQLDYILTPSSGGAVTSEERKLANQQAKFSLDRVKESNGSESSKIPYHATLSVNEQGEMELPENLKPGQYKISMTVIPDGFTKAGDVYFTVNTDNCVITVPPISSVECNDFFLKINGPVPQKIEVKVTYKKGTAQEKVYQLKNNGDTFISKDANEPFPTKLPAGNYLVEYSSISSGYQLRDMTKTFTVTEGNCLTNLFLTVVKCADIVFQYTVPTGAAANARFEVRDENQQVIYSELKAVAGKVTLPSTDVEPGRYTLVQTTATTGFNKIAPTAFEVKMNTCLATITLPTPVECADFTLLYEGPIGSEFTLTADNQSYELRIVEKSDRKYIEEKAGTTPLPKHLVEGSYTLKQTKVPTGYTYADTVKFTVTNGECLVLPVIIVKKCADFAISYTGPIGAKFELASEDGSKRYVLESTADNRLVLSSSGQPVPTALEPGNYTLVQTKTPNGYMKQLDKKIVVLDTLSSGENICAAVVKIEMEYCGDLVISYVGPQNSKAEFKLVAVTKDGAGKEVETILATGIKVITDPTDLTMKKQILNIQSANSTLTALPAGNYKVIQTVATPGYTMTSKAFEVVEGVCQAPISLTNVFIPLVCEKEKNIKVTDENGLVVELSNTTKVTIDGVERVVKIQGNQVIIANKYVMSNEEHTIVIELEDGRSVKVHLNKDDKDCDIHVTIADLKICESNPHIMLAKMNGKEIPASEVERVLINGKNSTFTIKDGELEVSRESFNHKVDSIITIVLKDGTTGVLLLPKYSANCDYLLIMDNACSLLTITITSGKNYVKSAIVEIVDDRGQVVSKQSISGSNRAKFEAKYANSKYKVRVTVGNKIVTAPINTNANCELTIDMPGAYTTLTINVTLNGKPVTSAIVQIIDRKGKVVATEKADETSQVTFESKYISDMYRVKVILKEQQKIASIILDKQNKMLVNLTTTSCGKGTMEVTLDNEKVHAALISIIDSKGRTVQIIKTDVSGRAIITEKYMDGSFSAVVTVNKMKKKYPLTTCTLIAAFKTELPTIPKLIKKPQKAILVPKVTVDKPKMILTTEVTAGRTTKETQEKEKNQYIIKTPDKKGVKYNLFDDSGRLIKGDLIVNASGEIEVKQLPKGVYLLVSKDGKREIQFEVVADRKLPQTSIDNSRQNAFLGIALLALGVIFLLRIRRKSSK